MTGQWAILSGIEGNLAAYEAVLSDLRWSTVDSLYILGDVVGLNGENEAVVQRLRSPRDHELSPQVCTGWWEEQCFNLHGMGLQMDVPELLDAYGADAVKTLWESLSRDAVQWLRSLDFGFHELDCLLIHGSTVSYSDELTPKTPAIQLCDRLIRADADHLFCGRSGQAFECWIEDGTLQSSVTTLDEPATVHQQTMRPRRVVGVGTVGRRPKQATYVLYSPTSNQVEFKTVSYGAGQGFQAARTQRSKTS